MGLCKVMGVKIINSRKQQATVVFEPTESDVTVLTQESADSPITNWRMVVIDGKMHGSTATSVTSRFLADRTDARLCGEHPVVLLNGNAVTHQQVSGSLFFLRWCRNMLLEYGFHVRQMWIKRLKFPGTVGGSGMFIARTDMKDHSFVRVLLSTIPARLELPRTRARFYTTVVAPIAVSVGWIFAPLMHSCKRTLLTGVTKAVKTAGFYGKLINGFNLLAMRASSFLRGKCGEVIAQSAPVAAQYFRGSCVAAKAAIHTDLAAYHFTPSYLGSLASSIRRRTAAERLHVHADASRSILSFTCWSTLKKRVSGFLGLACSMQSQCISEYGTLQYNFVRR